MITLFAFVLKFSLLLGEDFRGKFLGINSLGLFKLKFLSFSIIAFGSTFSHRCVIKKVLFILSAIFPIFTNIPQFLLLYSSFQITTAYSYRLNTAWLTFCKLSYTAKQALK